MGKRLDRAPGYTHRTVCAPVDAQEGQPREECYTVSCTDGLADAGMLCMLHEDSTVSTCCSAAVAGKAAVTPIYFCAHHAV
jgi:hypothetical protein